MDLGNRNGQSRILLLIDPVPVHCFSTTNALSCFLYSIYIRFGINKYMCLLYGVKSTPSQVQVMSSKSFFLNTNCWHSEGYKLCSSGSRFVFIYFPTIEIRDFSFCY